MTQKPILTIDFDGIICRPIFNKNWGIHSTPTDPSKMADLATITPRWWGDLWDHIRFDRRQILPNTIEALENLTCLRTLILLTGRRSSPEKWLIKYKLSHYFSDVIINTSPYKSAYYKLKYIQSHEVKEHIDDDPRTVWLLSEHSKAKIFLRNWPENHNLEISKPIERINSLVELSYFLQKNS